MKNERDNFELICYNGLFDGNYINYIIIIIIIIMMMMMMMMMIK